MEDSEIEAKAREELDRVDNIIDNLEVLDREKASSLLGVLNSYHDDCRGFVQRGQFLEALEAAFICWAYVDAGLHLGVFKVPDSLDGTFTV